MVGVGIFLILALVAGILGFGGITEIGVAVARALFFVFMVSVLVGVLAIGFAREMRDERGSSGD